MVNNRPAPQDPSLARERTAMSRTRTALTAIVLATIVCRAAQSQSDSLGTATVVIALVILLCVVAAALGVLLAGWRSSCLALACAAALFGLAVAMLSIALAAHTDPASAHPAGHTRPWIPVDT